MRWLLDALEHETPILHLGRRGCELESEWISPVLLWFTFTFLAPSLSLFGLWLVPPLSGCLLALWWLREREREVVLWCRVDRNKLYWRPSLQAKQWHTALPSIWFLIGCVCLSPPQPPPLTAPHPQERLLWLIDMMEVGIRKWWRPTHTHTQVPSGYMSTTHTHSHPGLWICSECLCSVLLLFFSFFSLRVGLDRSCSVGNEGGASPLGPLSVCERAGSGWERCRRPPK